MTNSLTVAAPTASLAAGTRHNRPALSHRYPNDQQYIQVFQDIERYRIALLVALLDIPETRQALRGWYSDDWHAFRKSVSEWMYEADGQIASNKKRNVAGGKTEPEGEQDEEQDAGANLPVDIRPQAKDTIAAWKAVGRELCSKDGHALGDRDKHVIVDMIMRVRPGDLQLFKLHESIKDLRLRKSVLAIIRQLDAAKTTAVKHHMRLVRSIARKHYRINAGQEDLEQEGVIGLMEAVNKYDWRLGHAFMVYAPHWIAQAIRRSIPRNSRTIRLPSHAYEDLGKIVKAQDKFAAEHGRLPTLEELARLVEMKPDNVRILLEHRRTTASLEAPINRDTEDSNTLADIIEDRDTPNGFDIVLDKQQRKILLDAVNQMEDEKLRQVVIMLYNLDGKGEMSFDEISKRLNVKLDKLRGMHEKVLRIFRQDMKAGRSALQKLSL